MKKDNFKIFDIDKETERNLFSDSIIFFDTSALLDFYYLSEKNKKQIFEKLFEQVMNRLFVTTQTEYEFLKNRDKVILKPLESYNSLISKSKNQKDGGHLEEIDTLIKGLATKVSGEIKGQFQTLIEKTSKNDKHPFLDNFTFLEILESTENLSKAIFDFQEKYKLFKGDIEKRIEEQKSKIQLIFDNDTILIAFEKYFSTTETMSYKETLKVIKEGELRYKNEIPPGYMDEEEKSGFQIYGDLIMWKQIIQECKKQKRNAILVINDLKEDWWYLHDNDKPLSPRHELIKEFNDETSKIFWMYDLNTFLHKSNQFIATKIEESVIAEIKEINVSTPLPESSVIKEWISLNYNYQSEIYFFEKSSSDSGLDYLIQDKMGDNIGFIHKQVNSILYVKILEPIRLFIINYPHLRKTLNIKELVLIIEYSSYEKANTFIKHSKQKKTLRSLINKFRNIIRLVVIVTESGSIDTIFDSYEKNIS